MIQPIINVIPVPESIEFLTDWKEFELPCGILNKGITGCGATSVAINDQHKTIICCPRIHLILNKCGQNPNMLGVYGEIGDMKIMEYLKDSKLPKIMVTYDSFSRVCKYIENKSEWRIVVDEYQYLLIDSGFRSEKTMDLLKELKKFDYVTYVSATPIADKYLQEIDHFKDMQYTILEWSNIEKITVKRVQSQCPILNAINIVENYKNNIFPEINGIESEECVIFVNSVANIGTIIRRTHLRPEDVNIIIADTEENKNYIKEIGKDFALGKIPLKDEPHKKFTFCTSTAFAGCDFYSTCASTFVISDNRKAHTSIDIATELKQIVGRQRLVCNPFRKFVTFIYNVDIGENDRETVLTELNEKLRKSIEIVEFKNNVPDNIKETLIIEALILQRIDKYSSNYVRYDDREQMFTVNKWVYLNDCFSYDVQHENYINSVTVKRQLNDNGFDTSEKINFSDYQEQISYLIKKGDFVDRMKKYCETRILCETSKFCLPDIFLERQYPELKYYYNELGAERIKALGYKESALKNEILKNNQMGNIIFELRKVFKSGMRLTNKEVKSMMANVYSKLGIKKNAVASHLEKEYGFKCKPVKISINGTRENGLEIL